MSEVEQETPKHVYRSGDVDYDVSKLSQEGQQAFMMLAEIQRGSLAKARLDVLIYEAAQVQFRSVIEGSLNEQAVIISKEDKEVQSE